MQTVLRVSFNQRAVLEEQSRRTNIVATVGEDLQFDSRNLIFARRQITMYSISIVGIFNFMKNRVALRWSFPRTLCNNQEKCTLICKQVQFTIELKNSSRSERFSNIDTIRSSRPRPSIVKASIIETEASNWFDSLIQLRTLEGIKNAVDHTCGRQAVRPLIGTSVKKSWRNYNSIIPELRYSCFPSNPSPFSRRQFRHGRLHRTSKKKRRFSAPLWTLWWIFQSTGSPIFFFSENFNVYLIFFFCIIICILSFHIFYS